MVTPDDLDEALEAVERYDTVTGAYALELFKLLVEAVKNLMGDDDA